MKSKIKLTKSSEKELRGWHPGSGKMFLSDGTGNSFTYCDIQFRKAENGNYYLAMGNSKAIKLTEEQVKILGCYAKDDTDD